VLRLARKVDGAILNSIAAPMRPIGVRCGSGPGSDCKTSHIYSWVSILKNVLDITERQCAAAEVRADQIAAAQGPEECVDGPVP
jgi:hypothetical protein